MNKLAPLGSSSHSKEEREKNDYYATDPIAIDLLWQVEPHLFEEANIWEPACGEGHMAKRIELYGCTHGSTVYSSDIVYRNFGEKLDFLKPDWLEYPGNIITNPPYKNAQEFIEKSLDIISEGFYVAMFLKLLFLEGKKRKQLFKKYPPKIIYISSSRIECGKSGVFKGSSAVAYAWYVWQKGYTGETIIKWIN